MSANRQQLQYIASTTEHNICN